LTYINIVKLRHLPFSLLVCYEEWHSLHPIQIDAGVTQNN
jgi:hypothetical protein